MHVAVFGAGYAGVTLTRRLERSLPGWVELTLVDERETHLVQHYIHRVVREPELAEQLTVPLSECCRRATVRQATVESVEPDEGRARLADGTLEYDLGVVCLGAQTAYHGLSGVRTHGMALKRLEDAQRIRAAFLELGETGGRAVVGGAGLSGVQIAGELAELAREADADTEVVLLEQQSTVAPQFPEQFREAIAAELESRGVEVVTGATVVGAGETAVELQSGEALSYDQLVWTGGITGQDALSVERPSVRSTLRLGDRTFGLGDAVRVVDDLGQPVPASAQTAVRQAAVVAENIERLIEGESEAFEPRLSRYVYSSPGWVVTVGDGTVAQVGSRVLRGSAAKALKTTIGVGHLVGVGAVEDAYALARDSVYSPERTQA